MSTGAPAHRQNFEGREPGSVALPVRATFAGGLALGVAGDLLLRGRGGPALNVFLLFAGLGAAVWVLSRRARLALSREALLALGVGIAFAAALVLRASEALRLFSFLAAALAFALPAFRAGAAWLRRSGVSTQIEAVGWAGVNALAGAFRLIGAALASRPAPGATPAAGQPAGAERHPAGAVLRGFLLAVPFLLAFGALFMSADRIFSRLVTDLVDLDFEKILSHVVVMAVLTWLACGYLTGFLTGTRLASLSAVVGARPALGVVEIGTALALVDLLFLLFVGVQFRYLFGGSGLVEVTPGLTYAEYARQGVGQLTLAGALALPSLLAADWLFQPRSRRDALVFRVLGGLLLLLLLVIIASALQRVRAYQAAYGLTEPRFYAAAFVGWLTVLILWFAATVLRGGRERFAFPALVSGFAFLGLLLAVNPDGWIARTNLKRAGGAAAVLERPGKGVDARYLASLSADAVPTLMNALPDLPPGPRCVLARGLLRRWGPNGTEAPDWRGWSWPVARARRMVGEETEGLRALAADAASCPPPPAAALDEARRELEARGRADQAVREGFGIGGRVDSTQVAVMAATDSANTAWLKSYVARWGWPTVDQVGREAVAAAFLIVQHAVHDTAFMRAMLPYIEASHRRGDVDGGAVAMLTDRLEVKAGRAQVYGTQLSLKDGRWVLDPIADSAGVDERRQRLGLPPLAEYLRLADSLFRAR